MNTELALFLFCGAIFFVSGFGWGKWHSEYLARKEKTESETDRLAISMPMLKKDSANVMRLLAHFIDDVQKEKSEGVTE